MNKVYLCSFWSMPAGVGTKWSVARFAPTQFGDVKMLRALAPFDVSGNPITIHSAGGTPETYRKAYVTALRTRLTDVEAAFDFVRDAATAGDVALMCWCDPTLGKAKEQVDHHGTFICHTQLIALSLLKRGIHVVQDPARVKYGYWASEVAAEQVRLSRATQHVPMVDTTARGPCELCGVPVDATEESVCVPCKNLIRGE